MCHTSESAVYLLWISSLLAGGRCIVTLRCCRCGCNTMEHRLSAACRPLASYFLQCCPPLQNFPCNTLPPTDWSESEFGSEHAGPLLAQPTI